MENKQMRSFLKMKGIPFWKIAETIGVSEPTMTRWMRKPLSAEHHEKIMDAVQMIERGDQDDEDNQTGK